MQCIVVKSDEFENLLPLIYFPQILIMLLLAPYGRSAAMTNVMSRKREDVWLKPNMNKCYFGRIFVANLLKTKAQFL